MRQHRRYYTMANVYSQTFYAVQGLDGSYEWECTTGSVAIVSCIDVYAAGIDTGDYRFIGYNNQTIDYWDFGASDTAATHQWRGHQVFHAGLSFFVQTTRPMDVTVAGYLLSAP